ncbi:LLM class flavin-dependent oxidoreductase [Enteractinococcus fodinae]|uniref:Alkanesulfonate monooxygenase SsuD/methylene tetrahydromethanopterin reductase-like flavin-dependent oxidoreductase (Luciferase family) n=1 Tax=Enteractinococcus fodinae TaxID=684663 RepID=A0ABU2AXN5_9MICC|nr:LLM class flavin-dependent oxidoreductase [Enteractinococcus fodinae]MDR7346117.1 alkanesulfonate monooxygenase SsuD/methylene tetrahydromethanopterin reductase-like flavin-dependent oxidoreductase (luciferase family) [Enteractinococcus fodinae]
MRANSKSPAQSDELSLDARDPELRRADWHAEEHQAHRRKGPLKLGFLTFLTQEHRDPTTVLQEGLKLFHEAEQLGYELGLVRVRHFQPYLSGPLAFLSAASQHTSTMRLGTGVIPMHAEDPIRLAEELQTLDLLSNGRVEAGFATSMPEQGVHSHWVDQVQTKQDSWEKFDSFLDRVSGVPVPTGPGTFLWGLPEGSDAITWPPSPTLRERIWYGAGSMNSVQQAAERGLKLQLSSVTDEAGVRFEPRQYQQIARYRELMAQLHPQRTPEVAVSRNILPMTGAASDDEFDWLVRFYTDNIYPNGTGRPEFPVGGRFSHPATGSVDNTIDFLRHDVALAAADTLLVLAPFYSDLQTTLSLLKLVAEEIVPALGS